MTKPVAGFQEPGFSSYTSFEFPAIVNVEVLRGSCPCACRHCPVGRIPQAKRGKRFGTREMVPALFARIVEEMACYPGRVLRLHAVGEPLLWKHLPTALDLTRRSGVLTWIFTSAVTDDLELLDSLSSNADVIEVSLNSIHRDDYQATKGIDAYETVVRNIARLAKSPARRDGGRIIVSRVESADKAADSAFVEYWRHSVLVDDAIVRSYHTYNSLLPELRDPNGEDASHEPCLVHWARFNVSVDGKAVVCFNELFREKLDPAVVLGDLTFESIKAIWQGPALKSLRTAELAGDYSMINFSQTLHCRNCADCQPIGGNRQTSEHQIRSLKITEGS